MSQILVNSRMCAIGRRPICQDTGSANIHIKYGMQAQTNFKRSLQEICDEGTRQGYLRDENPLRALSWSIHLIPVKTRATIRPHADR